MKVQHLLEGGTYAKMAAENRARIKAEKAEAAAKLKKEKQEAAKASKATEAARKEAKDENLYQKVMQAISATYPDADALDWISDYLEKNRYDERDVDRVFKKYEKCTYDEYMRDFGK